MVDDPLEKNIPTIIKPPPIVLGKIIAEVEHTSKKNIKPVVCTN